MKKEGSAFQQVGQFALAQRHHNLGLRDYERRKAGRMGQPDPFPGPDLRMLEARLDLFRRGRLFGRVPP